MTATARERVRTVLGLVVSVVAVAAIVLWASRQQAPSFPTSAGHLAELAAALGVYAVATLLRAYRWHVILRLDGLPHRRADALGLLLVGYMGNTVLPARGGEVLRIYLLSQRTGARKRAVLGSILAERGLDAAVLAGFFVTLTILGVAGAPAGGLPAIIAAAALALALVGGLIFLRLRRQGRLQGFTDRVRPVLSASRPLWGPAGAGLVAVTAAVWALEGTVLSLIATSLGLHVNVLEGIFLDVLASFFSLIPAAPGYVGTFDAAMLFGLHALDLRGGDAFSFTLLVRFILFVPITLLGGILLLTRYGGLPQLRRMRASVAA